MADRTPNNTAHVNSKKKPSRAPYIAALLFIAAVGVSVVVYSLGGWSASAKAKKLKNPYPVTADAIHSGMETYTLHCQKCHGATGNGRGEKTDQLAIAPADFTDAHKMAGISDGEMFYMITKGDDPMPSFEGKLTEEERWQAVEFIRTFAQRAATAEEQGPSRSEAAPARQTN